MKRETLIEIDGWALVDAKHVSEDKKDITDSRCLLSFMWHECDALKWEYKDEEVDGNESEIRYLDTEDSQMGKCWYCMKEAPKDLKTLWTIHNMSIMHQLNNPLEASWHDSYVSERLKDISNAKKRWENE